MSDDPSYFLIEENTEISGPHSLLVLRQKAEVGVLHPKSLVRPHNAPTGAPWQTLASLPHLHLTLFPRRPSPTLRAPTPITGTNATFDATSAPIDVQDALNETTARLNPAEKKSEDTPPAYPQRYTYRRRRDYFVCAATLNLFCLAAGAWVGFLNPFLLGLFFLGNVSLLWILFVVLDRY